MPCELCGAAPPHVPQLQPTIYVNTVRDFAVGPGRDSGELEVEVA